MPSMHNIIFSKLNLYQEIIFCMEDAGHLSIHLDKWVNPSGGSKGPHHFEFFFKKIQSGSGDGPFIKGIGDAGSTADNRMLWSTVVCLGLL